MVLKKQWTKDEEIKLTEIFQNIRNCELAEIFKTTSSSIAAKARSLKLRKTVEHKSKNIGNRNKMVGRDLSFDFVKEIALSCKMRAEFQKKDPSAYTTARVNGWLNDICCHMIKGNYSIPQLILKDFLSQIINSEIHYNDRKVIKPKEIDIWMPEYNLAFEYDGKGWHIEDNNKVELCKCKNITLIVIKENSRNYEDDIKNQLIENLAKINNVTNLKITKENILSLNTTSQCFDKILDEDSIMVICKKYTDLRQFRTEKLGIYAKIVKMKKLDFFTKHMKRNHIDWSKKQIEEINDIIKKYNYLGDFIKQQRGLYIYLRRNKNITHLLSVLKSKLIYRNLDDLIMELKNGNFKKICQIRKNNIHLYEYLIRTIGGTEMKKIIANNTSV